MAGKRKQVTRQTKRPNYTDEFRASAVAALYAEGYPDTPGKLSKIAKAFKLHERTLQRWADGVSNPPPDKNVNEKKEDLATLIETEVYAIIDLMPSKREAAHYSQLTIALGTLIDKMRLLRGLPTEIVQVMPELVNEANRAGADLPLILQNLTSKLKQARANGDIIH